MLLYLCLLLLSLLSPPNPPVAPAAPGLTEHDFRPLFEQYGLHGSLLLYDAAAGRYIAYNPKRCRQGFIPASTFKIPNTLIGLETGALPDTAEVCRWDGVRRSFPQWEKQKPLLASRKGLFRCLKPFDVAFPGRGRTSMDDV